MSEWISVSERLPEDEVEVLIYTKDNEINKAYRRHKSWTENQKEWLVFETLGYGYIYDDDEVLAWMPLPKPYESKEIEDKSKKTGIKLDEVIERYTSNAEFERTHGNLQGCLEFRQLAKWLRELKMYRHYLLKAEVEPQESEDKEWQE